MASIDDEIKTRFQNNRHRMIANLVFTANWFEHQVEEFMRPFQISQQQFNILRILRGAGDWVSMNDIKSLMVDRYSNTTRLSNKLIEKELVERKRSDKDRRIVYLAITSKGLDLLQQMDEVEAPPHLSFMDRITEEEAQQFSDLLDKLRG